MQLQFLGATGTVTGSKYLLGTAGGQVLVDCGLFQGYKQMRLRNWAPLPVDPAQVRAVVLTHAHLDHSGYLPLLVKNGFRGKVYCSHATRELCEILLMDSAHLLEEEAAYANRKGFSKHQPALPLYTQQDAQRSLKHLHGVEFDAPFSPVPGLHAKLTWSGHMLGSSFARFHDGERSVLFSGDVGRPTDLLLRAAHAVEAADHLVCESTYGDRLHERVDVLASLAEVIGRTAARGGVVVIPAFAVGRAQALLHALAVLKARRAIPSLPVYLNSPMASRALDVYRRHPELHRLNHAQFDAMMDSVHVVESIEESRALNGRHGPMVIIAASGMATGGRVVHHLRALAPDHRNTILFTSYQAGGTRGASFLAGAKTVRMLGTDVPVRAEVAMLDNLSAHADAGELLDWLRSLPRAPRKTFITHGEPAAADALRQRIERELRWDCTVPEYLQTVRLE
ncbi:MAG TPA: MBL fold metallo-hydrolase [Rhizobacter sp.]